jgi:hypothetical protein
MSNVVSFSAGSALPVTWLYIKAMLNNNNGVISWGTASEQNTDRFEVEHSVDGSSFVKIGTQPAAGNSSIAVNYSFTHNALPKGMNYYRIKQVDLDGNYKYSAVVALLNRNGLRNTIIAPNPVGEMLHIIEPAQTKLLTAEVYSNAGALVMHVTINSNGQVHSLPVTKLPAGIYRLRLKYENAPDSYRVKTLSFVKQ